MLLSETPRFAGAVTTRDGTDDLVERLTKLSGAEIDLRGSDMDDALARVARAASAAVGDGSDRTELADACHDLAALLDARGRVEEAAGLYERALAIKREALGSGHPALVPTLHNLALLKEASGRLDEANALWVEARTAVDSARRPT